MPKYDLDGFLAGWDGARQCDNPLAAAMMHLLGTANWWVPTWVDRRLLPLSVDPPNDPGGGAPVPVATAAAPITR